MISGNFLGNKNDYNKTKKKKKVFFEPNVGEEKIRINMWMQVQDKNHHCFLIPIRVLIQKSKVENYKVALTKLNMRTAQKTN